MNGAARKTPRIRFPQESHRASDHGSAVLSPSYQMREELIILAELYRQIGIIQTVESHEPIPPLFRDGQIASLEQETRRPVLEPVGPELIAVEQQQYVIGVVDPLSAPPVMAVEPSPDFLPVESVKLLSEYVIYIIVWAATDRGVVWIEVDVPQVVET